MPNGWGASISAFLFLVAALVAPVPSAFAYASAAQDGHGRTVRVTERAHAGGGIEGRDTVTEYLSTGEAHRITRTRGAGDDVVRWIRYDSLGRMVLNVEPNTTVGFTGDESVNASSLRAWRYAYDDNGNVVGTSDARGCGANFHYDTAGRIVAEDYSPCVAGQAAYSAPDLGSGDGAEVFYQYDALPADLENASFGGCQIEGWYRSGRAMVSLMAGRLVSVADRGARTVTGFDGRGRATCVARQLAVPTGPGEGHDAFATRYAPRWYAQSVTYDVADRPEWETTGSAVVSPGSAVRAQYSRRGTVRGVEWSGGGLITRVVRDADGLVKEIERGDLAATKTSMSYDGRRRLASVQTYRGTPAAWSAPPASYVPAPEMGGGPSTFQLLLEDVDFAYDAVDNPVELRDWRDPAAWPAGAQPVTRKVQYDDLYRVTRVDYTYPGGVDAWVDPYAHEAGGERDPRAGEPSPRVRFDRRVLRQTFAYDWLGNTSETTDDAGGFYERSLGAIVNGTAEGKPYQLKSASGGSAPRDGGLTTAYDEAGNLVGLSVERNANAPCVGGVCSARYAYEWDEVGRMSRARRWDGRGLGGAGEAVPEGVPAAELRYAYDAGDDRVRKTAVDGAGNEVHTAYVFDSLELRRARFQGGEYERNEWTEVPYLYAHGVRLARLHYATSDVPTLTSGNVHVLMELPDHLGSGSIVIDQATGELVERATYQAYGGVESDYRPERWGGYREDYRFTGKEEDIEVGVEYFGKRYYAPQLGRWVSADPLTTHALGADPNSYAYVSGRSLNAVDHVGLVDTTTDDGAKQFLRDKATSGAKSAGVRDAREVAMPPEMNPLNDSSIRAQFGLTETPVDFDADHIVPAREIMKDPEFNRLTIRQQLDVLRTPENIAMLERRMNQEIKGGRTMSDLVLDYGIQGEARTKLLSMSQKAHAAVTDKISGYIKENAQSGVDVVAEDVNFLQLTFPRNQDAQALARRLGDARARPAPGRVEGGEWGAPAPAGGQGLKREDVRTRLPRESGGEVGPGGVVSRGCRVRSGINRVGTGVTIFGIFWDALMLTMDKRACEQGHNEYCIPGPRRGGGGA